MSCCSSCCADHCPYCGRYRYPKPWRYEPVPVRPYWVPVPVPYIPVCPQPQPVIPRFWLR